MLAWMPISPVGSPGSQSPSEAEKDCLGLPRERFEWTLDMLGWGYSKPSALHGKSLEMLTVDFCRKPLGHSETKPQPMMVTVTSQGLECI